MAHLIPFAQRFIAGISTRTVSARKLHTFLVVKRDFSSWIKTRIDQYKFEENQDFILIHQNGGIKKRGGDRKSVDYYLTLDMAKELCMVERNENGKQARRYFIECEKELTQKRINEAKADTLPQQSKIGKSKISPELRRAINHKAHSLSLRGYDIIRSELTKWTEDWCQAMGEEEAARRLNEYDGLCGEMVFINAAHIREITTSVDVIELAVERAMKGIKKLEESSGRDWINHE